MRAAGRGPRSRHRLGRFARLLHTASFVTTEAQSRAGEQRWVEADEDVDERIGAFDQRGNRHGDTSSTTNTTDDPRGRSFRWPDLEALPKR